MTNTNVTLGVIAALRVIREQDRGPEFRDAMSVLDNAGIFAEIDAATKCICPPENVKFGGHLYHCPARAAAKCICPRSRVIFPTPLGNDMHTVGCPGE